MKPLPPSKIIFISGVLGFLLGSIIYPKWMDSVAFAQSIAGLVNLPKDSHLYITHSFHYSLFLVQIPALLLKLGFSEWWLCVLISGFQGFICFTAISSVALLFTECALIGLLVPFLYKIIVVHLTPHNYGVYFIEGNPIISISAVHMLLLSLALFLLGTRRLSLFLLGILPAVHPMLGILGWILLVLLLLEKSVWSQIKMPHFLSFGSGALLFSLSLLFHILFIAIEPQGLDPQKLSEIHHAYFNAWCAHRSKINLMWFFVDFIFILFSADLLTRQKKILPLRARSLLRSFLLLNAVLLPLVFLLYSFAQGSAPDFLQYAIPTRFLNLNCMILGVMICTLPYVVGQSGRTITAALSFSAVFIPWVLVHTFGIWIQTFTADGIPTFASVYLRPFYFVPLILMLGLEIKSSNLIVNFAKFTRGFTLFLIAFLFLKEMRKFDFNKFKGIDSNTELFESANKAGGTILSPISDPSIFSLRARIPVLYFTDGVAYSKAAALAQERFLNTLFDVSMLEPTDKERLRNRSLRTLWENRTESEWQRLTQEWRITQVLVPQDWQLKLPLFASSRDYSLYSIATR